MARYDLRHYDGVLAYGEVLREVYLRRGWAERAWTWHEAADVRLFRPLLGRERAGDLVWIGNWGDGERTAELREFLLGPAQQLGLKGSVFGVRYPPAARKRIAQAGLPYRGWVANHRVPEIFARHALTVHVPRRPYVRALPGIPTIRPFEALACGIPLICSPWDDVEGLFTAGEDFLVASDGDEMRRLIERVLRDRDLARHLVQHGRRTILERHTCGHRVDELLAIAAELGVETAPGEDVATTTVS
jgi:spore maturation protein CgeB